MPRVNACDVYGARATAYVDAVRATLRARRDGGDDDDATWTLDTKYYVAGVRARVVDGDGDGASENGGGRARWRDGRPRAVVLACGSAEEFARGRDALERDARDDEDATEAFEGVDARIVAYDVSEARETGVPEDVRAWALDRMFEVVEVRLDDAAADEALTTDAATDEDAHGVRRTIAALEATMWDVLELKSLGEESDLGREMRARTTTTTTTTRTREDVESLAVANGLLGDDASESPSAMSEGVVQARIAALYNDALALKEEERLEKLADILAGDLSL